LPASLQKSLKIKADIDHDLSEGVIIPCRNIKLSAKYLIFSIEAMKWISYILIFY
jgi:hypothetical protein